MKEVFFPNYLNLSVFGIAFWICMTWGAKVDLLARKIFFRRKQPQNDPKFLTNLGGAGRQILDTTMRNFLQMDYGINQKVNYWVKCSVPNNFQREFFSWKIFTQRPGLTVATRPWREEPRKVLVSWWGPHRAREREPEWARRARVSQRGQEWVRESKLRLCIRLHQMKLK